MVLILYIEMLVVLILGIGYICQIKLNRTLDKKINLLQNLLQAKNEEIDSLKCQH